MEKTCYQTHWCSDVETDSTIAATAASPPTSVINCASIFGAFTDSSGNIMIIEPESLTNSAAITVVIQNSVGTVIGSDSGSFTAPTITLSVAGTGIYDGTGCTIDWTNGMADWIKQYDLTAGWVLALDYKRAK